VLSASDFNLSVPYCHPERDACVPKGLMEILRAPVLENFVPRGDHQDGMSLAQEFMGYPPRVVILIFLLAPGWGLLPALAADRDARSRHSYLRILHRN